jgi:acyl transferase domain-containing protein/NAD(P)H-dependent flavin oxidoreductase YrpB (nitropropane dioxygenase family)/NAD(P)-dependent dehydrogenase (short-subunit alcohol dehydrogenase family)
VRSFQSLVLTPPGLTDPAIAIAGSRAGGMGVLDLEYATNASDALTAVTRLARYARGECGIKLDGSRQDFLQEVVAALPPEVTFAVLTAADAESLKAHAALLRSRRIRILLETTCVEEASRGEAVGVNGLVAKGHEAGGWVGEETTFILLQRLLAVASLPIWAHGGIGLHSAAACYAAGAAGVVLDLQLALVRESPLPAKAKGVIARLDGAETICLRGAGTKSCRIYCRPDLTVVKALRSRSTGDAGTPPSEANGLGDLAREIAAHIGWDDPDKQVWLLGQDAAFAADFAKRFVTVAGVLDGVRGAVETHVRTAQRLQPLQENGPLARAHGTRYPIVQGPMTRVSDRPEFAAAVADGGALPFLALALMRAPEVKTLLEETRRALGNRPWGVGVLGFVPLDLRQEQLDVIRGCRPAFALIAGGRPDQAAVLEEAGIPTYLHVPSPGLLKLFVENGSRRFVFEGRECGGHVGPRSSFVLWNTMIDTLLETVPPSELASCHVLFAGGIHDALSAAMVATMAAPLAQHQVKVGVLLGTAYLFTPEAVASGAILDGFQQEALRCADTVLLETGPGHATRCVPTPYADDFQREKAALIAAGRSGDEVRNALEQMNLGRLRIAAKGVVRNGPSGGNSTARKLLPLTAEAQRTQGMYMIGQVAALRDGTCTIAELHRQVSVEGSVRLAGLPTSERSECEGRTNEPPSDVAIIGMSCLFPKAGSLQAYWENILNKVDAVAEVPPHRFEWQRYFDANPDCPDKVYSKWGGFLDAVPFDPVAYGMPPSAVPSIEPLQLLTLETARAALEDAGYGQRPLPRTRTSVIVGVGGGLADLGQRYAFRSALPTMFDDGPADLLSRLPTWTEDSFAGILLNVAAGRVANRFDFGGVNYTIDAACASSLAAVHAAVRELDSGASDVVIAGGADTVQNPFSYLCFSKTHALSPRGRCAPFAADADGIVISEGVAMLVLKRLADAERDGDRIYAVIKAVAGASDGRDKGLTAPRPEGQERALQRAYAKAGFTAAGVGLIEAHGTGTVAGDRAETEALQRVFLEAGAPPRRCALGSVKSMIGHTKCTAGVAGLIKAALSLHERVLPPTLHVGRPNASVSAADSPFFINTEARPWLAADNNAPRRAGVSAFGFGGTNFHAVLEEYSGGFLHDDRAPVARRWPSELFVWAANSREELACALGRLDEALAAGAAPELADLACTLWHAMNAEAALRLAIVVGSLADLRTKLRSSIERLRSGGAPAISDPRGVYLAEIPAPTGGKVAFLFPGQGSQYVNMLADLARSFPEVRERFEVADQALAGVLPARLSSSIYPPTTHSPQDQEAQREALKRTNVAQPALGAASIGLLRLLQGLGIKPDLVAGHSYGEHVALAAAGVFPEEELYRISEARGRIILESLDGEAGAMAAVHEPPARVAELLRQTQNVWIANVNSPRQTVVSGSRTGVDAAVALLRCKGCHATPLRVACAFHSPLIAPAHDRFAKFLAQRTFAAPQVAIYSNSSAAPYPADPEAIRTQLTGHLLAPVRFAEEVEAMYEAGARVFIEVGPRAVLTGLVEEILNGRPHLAVALDAEGRPGLVVLHHALARLIAAGIPLALERLYAGRCKKELPVDALLEEARPRPLSATAWLVYGDRARRPEEALVPVTPVSLHNRHVPTSAAKVEIAPPPSPPAVSAAAVSTPARSRAAAPADETARVMVRFQGMMQQFLATQQQVMLTYLQGAPTVSLRPTKIPQGVVAALTQNGACKTSLRTEQEVPHANGASMSVPSAIRSSNGPEAEQTRAGGDACDLPDLVLRVISDRTGYPTDVLQPDLDIEADLGIDSIKRIEVLGAIRKELPLPDQPKLQRELEKLAHLKTIRAITQALKDALDGRRAPGANGATERVEWVGKASLASVGASGAIPRFTLRAVEAQLPSDSGGGVVPGVYLITDDARGIAGAVGEVLRRHGAQVIIATPPDRPAAAEFNQVPCDLTDPSAIDELVKRLRREHGPITGVVHLAPLRPAPPWNEWDFNAWQRRLAVETQSLFHFARAVGADLKNRSAPAPGLLMAATALGGTSAILPPLVESFVPTQGGVTGLMKSLALEWPQVRCKTIDLERAVCPEQASRHILAEMCAASDEVEIGYQNGLRYVLCARPAPFSPHSRSAGIPPRSVWLVTGGARGITACCALELARRFQPTLSIVGRSALPSAAEEPATKGLTSARDIKAALMETMRREGRPMNPAAVEDVYRRLLRDREIRDNLPALTDAGASVEYSQVDVREPDSFGRVIDDLYERHGRIDGALHGAGVIEDKLLDDKSPESFTRVLETKLTGAFVLSQKLRPESLKHLAFFSSVAGRFGNRGQCDYAAANEVLNKLARHLNARWPARVVALNWGPWEMKGMVSAEVRRQFAERGVGLLDPVCGSRALVDELLTGAKDEVEVIWGDGPWSGAPAHRTSVSFPLLDGTACSVEAGAAFVVTCTLDVSKHRYLDDHRLDGKPVLPAAMALELIAEVVQKGWPDWQVLGIHSVRVLRGVVLEDGPKRIAVRACSETQPAAEGDMFVDVAITDLDGGGTTCYRATVQLGHTLSEPPQSPMSFSAEDEFPLSAEEAYERWLFHGVRFQSLQKLNGIGKQGLAADVRTSTPEACLSGTTAATWLLDPVVLDSGPQLAILWSRAVHDTTALPTRIGSYRRFGPAPRGTLRCTFHVLESTEEMVKANVCFADDAGRLVGLLEGLECTCSRSLNRLAEASRRQEPSDVNLVQQS